MSPQILRPVRPVILLGVALASFTSGGLTIHTARADECLTAPTGKTPQGSHWYYRTDRVHNRKCWFVRSEPQQAASANAATKPSVSQATAAGQNGADTCLAAPKGPAPKGQHWFYHLNRTTNQKCWHLGDVDQTAAPNATTDAKAAPAAPAAKPVPAATPEADSVWSRAPRAAQPETVSSGADSDQQTMRDVTGAPAAAAPEAIANTPASTFSSSSQTADQTTEAPSATAPAPHATPALTDTGAAAPSDWPASSARAETPAPVVDTPAQRENALARIKETGVTSAREPIADEVAAPPSAKQASASGTTPLSVLLIVALALALTAILYRVGLKLLAMRPPRVIIDRTGYDWTENRYAEASTVPQQPADPVPPSIVPATAELTFPHPTGREWPRDGRGSRIVQRQGPHQGSHQASREERLDGLLRDLDELLKSRKDT